MTNELDRKVRKAVLSVKRRRVLERINALLRHYRAVKFTVHSAHTEIKGELTLNIGGAPTLFKVESFGPYDANTMYEVRYGGSLVLEVVSGMDELADGMDSRLVYRHKGDTVVVRTFKSGLWMKLLDLNWLLRQEMRRKRDAEKARVREAARKTKPEKVREDDYSIAQRFGLKSPERNPVRRPVLPEGERSGRPYVPEDDPQYEEDRPPFPR